MVETEDEVQSIQSNATVQSISKDTNQDMPLDTLKGKSALVDSEEEETITTTQVTSTKGDDGEEKVVTTTQTSTKMGDGGIAQRVTKVTKTKKVVKKVTKVKKEEGNKLPTTLVLCLASNHVLVTQENQHVHLPI